MSTRDSLITTIPGTYDKNGRFKFDEPLSLHPDERLTLNGMLHADGTFTFGKPQLETPLSLLDEDRPEARRRQAAQRSECAANWQLKAGSVVKRSPYETSLYGGTQQEHGTSSFQSVYEAAARSKLDRLQMQKRRQTRARVISTLLGAFLVGCIIGVAGIGLGIW
jgi:hypothetical protein